MPRGLRHSPLENVDSLQRVGPIRRLARLDVPELPRRAVHYCLGEERRDVEIVWVGAVDLAHEIGIISFQIGVTSSGSFEG